MDLSKLTSQLIGNKLDLNGDGVPDNLSDALSSLLRKADTAGENVGVELAGVVEKMKTSGGSLQETVSSWLGDGENMPISKEQITDMFSSEKISEFASKLGVSTEKASHAFSEALPQIIDKASSTSNLFDSVKDQINENTGGLMDKLNNMFK